MYGDAKANVCRTIAKRAC
jgi:hypothetical protein